MIAALSIYQTAEELVRQCGSRDPSIIADALGIEILYNEFEKLLGAYTRLLGRRFIVLNSNLSQEMYNIVLAHEIGHDCLHSDDSSSFQEFTMVCKSGTLEYEANSFCSHLLISNDNFFEAALSGNTVENIAACLSVDPNIVLIKGNELAKMGYKINNCDDYNSCFLRNRSPL